ncbi:hypothetical protein BURPS305_7838 [Burkholderia pseudomallei 305]|nr:hypothetical protein BURPS305_7838 [Burkholderia pseudomallei 305]
MIVGRAVPRRRVARCGGPAPIGPQRSGRLRAH